MHLLAYQPTSLPAIAPAVFCLGIPNPAHGLTPHPGVTGPCVECGLLAYLCRLWIVVRWPEFRPGRTRHAQIFSILGLRAFSGPAYQPTHLLSYYLRTFSSYNPAYQPTHLRFIILGPTVSPVSPIDPQTSLSSVVPFYIQRTNIVFASTDFKHLSRQPNDQRTYQPASLPAYQST